MKKVIALILAALLAFTAFACGKTDNGGSGNGGETEPKIVSKLVENGKSAYSIVIPENADECNEFAAEELRRYIERASGARLAIMRDDALPSVSTDGKYISLGKTKILAGSGVTFDYSSLNGDGFYLKTAGKTLLRRLRNSRIAVRRQIPHRRLHLRSDRNRSRTPRNRPQGSPRRSVARLLRLPRHERPRLRLAYAVFHQVPRNARPLRRYGT